MIPTIFEADYIDKLSYSGNVPTFPEHGIVDLTDCIECIAEENSDDGSSWEIELTYPQNGVGFGEIQMDRIIVAKANHYQSPQAFRIYSIEKSIKQTVDVKAQHISYDMINVPVKPFTVKKPSDAVTNLRTKTIYGDSWKSKHHFYISTNITSSDEFKFEEPRSMRSVLLDGDNSIKGTYGGDLIFDNYDVSLKQVGGEDRGVVINYGVDLIDLTQEQNNSEIITGILPYFKKNESDAGYATTPIIYGDIIYAGGVKTPPSNYLIQKIESVDLSEHFPNSVPKATDVTNTAIKWVKKEKIGEPEISLTVSYALLGQDVRMHDAITVKFPKMGIDTMAKVSRYRYDVLKEQCIEIDVGKAKSTKYFNLLDASKLKKGLIPPKRIASKSITQDKIARGGVGKGNIAGGAVGKMEMEPMSVDEEVLSQKAVINSMLNDGIVKKNPYKGDYPDGKEYLLNQINVHPAQLPKKAFRYTDTGTGNNSKPPENFDLNPDIVTNNTLPGGKVKNGGITKAKTSDAVQDSLANGDEAAEAVSKFWSGSAISVNTIFIGGKQCGVRTVQITIPGEPAQTFEVVKPI